MAKSVRGTMTENPRSIKASASVVEAARLMREEEGTATAQPRVCPAPIRGRRHRFTGVASVIGSGTVALVC